MTAENSLFSAFIARVATLPTQDSEGRDESSGTAELVVGEPQQESAARESSNRSPNRVFVVHGQNDSARSAIVSFLSSVGLDGIVLHDQPSYVPPKETHQWAVGIGFFVRMLMVHAMDRNPPRRRVL